jgi:hypothetical protein
MSEQAIATVEELPAELRAELVAKREAGTTLAELKKAYPQVAPDVIRPVLPPLPKGTEAKLTTGKPQAAKPAQTPARGSLQGRASPAKTAQPKSKPAASSNGTDDKARAKLAAQVVKLREDQGMS